MFTKTKKLSPKGFNPVNLTPLLYSDLHGSFNISIFKTTKLMHQMTFQT